MSEQAKPVCVQCGCAIRGKVYGDVGRDGPRHFCTISCTRAERDHLRAALDQERAGNSDLEDVLHRNGFVRCDVPACNCGSWHARYGLRERMNDISDALAEAGHPLDNSNGHIALEALRNLIAERDLFKREMVALAKDALAMKDALDRERAGNERLRAFAESVDWGARGRYGQVLKSREWIRRKMIRAGLMEDDGRPTALLSGRGEGEGNG